MDNYLTENIDTVIFDIGNVLIHFAWEDYLHDLGYEGTMFDRVADAVFRSDDWDKGDLSSDDSRNSHEEDSHVDRLLANGGKLSH